MKTRILLLALLLVFSLNSQSQSLQKEVQHPDYAAKLFRNSGQQKNKPIGSPYVLNTFSKAKVTGLNIDAFMRYNVHKDEMEFITPKNDTLILDKIEDFSEVVFYFPNRRYKLLQYTKNKELFNGYLIELTKKGDYILYKKDNITLTEAKPAKTSLEQNMPAKYNKMGSDYFYKFKDNSVIDFPDGKKALVKLFPDRKAEIESFLKEAKIDFSKEADLIQIINLLAK